MDAASAKGLAEVTIDVSSYAAGALDVADEEIAVHSYNIVQYRQ